MDLFVWFLDGSAFPEKDVQEPIGMAESLDKLQWVLASCHLDSLHVKTVFFENVIKLRVPFILAFRLLCCWRIF